MGAEAQRRDIDRLVTGISGDLLFGGWVSPGGGLLLLGNVTWAAAYARRRRDHHPSIVRTMRAEIIGLIARQLFPRWWAGRHAPPFRLPLGVSGRRLAT